MIADLGFGIWDFQRRLVFPPKPEKIEREERNEPPVVVLLVERPFAAELPAKDKPECRQHNKTSERTDGPAL